MPTSAKAITQLTMKINYKTYEAKDREKLLSLMVELGYMTPPEEIKRSMELI